MIISLMLAQIIGLYFILTSIIMLVCPASYRKFADSIPNNPAASMLGATMALILGIIMVVFHTLLVWDWRLVITVIAWLTAVKGLVWMIIPDFPAKYASKCLSGSMRYVLGGIFLLLGIFLYFQGVCESNWALVA